MFETLDERMKHDEEQESTPRERMLKWVIIAVVSLAAFGGLVMGVRMLG